MHQKYIKINQEAQRYAEEVGSFYLEVSAKVNMNIEKLFEEIANRLPKIQSKPDPIVLETPKEQSSGSKCSSC